MATIKKEDVLSYLESANMLEISELIKDIEDKFGVSAAAPVAVAGGAAPAAADAAGEEKSEFNVELTGVGEAAGSYKEFEVKGKVFSTVRFR